MEPLPSGSPSRFPAAAPVPPGWDLEDFEVFGPAVTEAPGAQIITGPWPARSHRVTHACWRQRAVASLIDSTVFVPALLAMVVMPMAAIILLAVAGAFSAWQVCCLQGATGQTIGKRQVGLFLVDETTLAPIGTRRATLRQLAHGIDAALLGVGYLWPLWDARHQTFADQLLGTVVASA